MTSFIISDFSKIQGLITLNGTGTVSILNSFNVSSIVDNGTGDYTINWDNDLLNDNYSLAGCSEDYCYIHIPEATPIIWNDQQVRINVRSYAGTLLDKRKISLIATGV